MQGDEAAAFFDIGLEIGRHHGGDVFFKPRRRVVGRAVGVALGIHNHVVFADHVVGQNVLCRHDNVQIKFFFQFAQASGDHFSRMPEIVADNQYFKHTHISLSYDCFSEIDSYHGISRPSASRTTRLRSS